MSKLAEFRNFQLVSWYLMFITIFYYIPKGAEIVLIKREHIKDIACLSGKLELNLNGIVQSITGFKKFRIDTDEFFGTALEDTYVLTTNRV